MTPAPNRRWFRWSLRMLFVVVTVLCVLMGWLIWNVSIVHGRRALRAQYNIGFQPFVDFGPLDRATFTKSPNCRKQATPNASPQISFIRRWLGDEPASTICVWDESDFEPVRERFPEALVEQFEPPKNWILRPDKPPTEVISNP